MNRATRLVAIVTTTGLVAAGAATRVAARPGHDDGAPSDAEVATAQQVSDLMLNELLAALFQEFGETTPDNVEQGKRAISLIFNDANRDMRLIGTTAPLLGGANDLPSDRFERKALDAAMTGTAATSVERVDGTWTFRRSVALSNTFHANCVLCHANFTPEFFERTNNPGQWVGALVLGVPIRADRHSP